MTDAASERIDRYQLLERIGAGGMARVYRAKDLNLDRIVAIKILHDHLADDPTFKERFEREAKLVASLNHPNIVQIYDFNTVERDGFPIYYMVMPYISGRSLKEVLEDAQKRGERLSYDRVLSIMLDVTDALAYAHDQGMIHRDVKPANILIDSDGKAVLTDFGIARLAASSRLTQEGLSTGTPAYMSPEQVSGQPGDARSDLYALGGIFFELMTGRPLFDDEGGASLMLKHLNAPIPSISAYLPRPNPLMDSFVEKALAKSPDQRFQTAREFARALRLIYTGRATGPLEVLPATGPLGRGGTGPLGRLPATGPLGRGGGTGLLNRPRGTGPLSLPPASSAQPIVDETQAVAPPTSRRLSPALGIAALAALAVIAALVVFSQIPRAAPPAPAATQTTNVVSTANLNKLLFTSTFDDRDANRVNWPQDNVAGFLREMTPGGFYHLRSERPGTASTSLFNPAYAYGNVSINMNGTLQPESNPAGAFGIVFRYQDQDHYNVFAVDGQGRYSIWVRDDGQWQELRGLPEKWTRDEAVNPRGGENRLIVETLGSSITGIVNGKQVMAVQDNTFSAGNIGIYVATHTTGVTDALVDLYQVFPASPPSMTDG